MTTLPLWSQTPEPVNSPPPAQVAASGTYETVPCSTLATPLGDEAPTSDASPFQIGEDVVEGTNYECGYLTVPELHSQPEGNTIQVGIVILKSPNPNPAEPLILFQGGPGGSSIELFPSLFLLFGEQILAERDVIAFEKRGNLYSRPFLDCPEYRESDSFAQVTVEESVQTLKACRDRLVQVPICRHPGSPD
jgi:hypothetical protein